MKLQPQPTELKIIWLTGMYGSQKLMEHLQFQKIHGMNPLDVELRLDYTSKKRLGST